MPVPQYDGVPVDMVVRPDMGTFNQIIIFSPAKPPGNTPIKLPGNPATAPGEPFVITGVTISLYQNGTSCINLAKWNVSVQYTGDVTGKTIDIYTNNRGEGNVLYIDAVLPFEEFLIPQEAYWNKPNSIRTFSVYVEETGNSSNNATSPERSIEGSVCT